MLISTVTAERTASSREPLSLAMLFAGFFYMRHNPIVLGVITLDLFAVVLGGVFALLPVFARDVFGADAWGLGLLRASPGIGALMAAGPDAPAAAAARRPHHVRARSQPTASRSSSSRCRARSSCRWSLLAILGAADMLSVVIRMTLIQLETPDDMRGRVSAVNSLFVTTSNQLGDFRAGLMASWLGTIPAVLVGGIGALIVVLIGRKVFAPLYRVESFEARR